MWRTSLKLFEYLNLMVQLRILWMLSTCNLIYMSNGLGVTDCRQCWWVWPNVKMKIQSHLKFYVKNLQYGILQQVVYYIRNLDKQIKKFLALTYLNAFNQIEKCIFKLKPSIISCQRYSIVLQCNFFVIVKL